MKKCIFRIVMGRPSVINEERLLRDRFNIPKGLWIKDKRMEGSYAVTFPELARTGGYRYCPRLTFNTECKSFNIYYPAIAPEAVDFKLTRRKMEREFKELLHPKKSLTLVERDSDRQNRKYQVDYYCSLDMAPGVETFDKIFAICQNPVTVE